MKRAQGLVLGSALTLALLAARPATAEVRLEGTWEEQKSVSLELRGVNRGEALRALAKEAGFSVVSPDLGDEPMDLQIEDEPADRVLAVLLAKGSWVAVRDGNIVTVRAAEPSDSPAKDRPKAKKERDVEVLGDSMRIGKDEVVHNVSVMGGNVRIEGRITGDLSVIGGNAEVAQTAIVEGDVSVTGGRIELEPGAQLEGDVTVLGGSVEGLDSAKIEGSVKLDPSEGPNKASFATRAVHRISESLRNAAMLFIIGCIFTALAGERADKLRASIAERPMKSIALGVVGFFGSLLVLALIAITIVGIPVAALGALVALLLVFSATASTFIVIGGAVYGHKSKSVYVQLAVGAALFMVAGFVPVIGGLAQAAVVCAGIGGLVATRGLGLVPRKLRDAHPFRSGPVG